MQQQFIRMYPELETLEQKIQRFNERYPCTVTRMHGAQRWFLWNSQIKNWELRLCPPAEWQGGKATLKKTQPSL